MGQTTITGNITDVSGEALIGASIVEKSNPTNGTITDFDGNFKLTVTDGNGSIIVSYTGFNTQELSLSGKTSFLIQMKEASELLEEVVVIGYGTTSKRSLTDNVARLSSSDIKDVPVSNFQSTMSGKAAGVRITQTNGKVDAGLNIRVRGTSSISAGAEPLYVLDGMPLINDNESNNGAPMNPLLSLSASEIESIDILKDASSAAIYGARGANGVVLITTKRGKEGKPTVSLNISRGVSTPTNKVEFLNAAEYIELFTEAAEYQPWGPDYITGLFDDLSAGTDWRNGEVDTDWNDVAFRDGSQTDVDFSVSGGDAKTTYYFGGAYNDTKGIILGNDLDRMTGRANVRHIFNNKFSAGLNIGMSKTNIDRIANDNAFVTPLQAIAQAPISPPRLDNGEPFDGTLYPNFLLENDYGNYRTVLRRVTGKAFGEYKLMENLKFNSDFGYDMSYQTEDQFRGSRTPFQSTNGEAYSSNVVSENYVFSNYLTWVQDIGERDNLNIVAGMEFNNSDRRFSSVTGTEFPSDDFQTVASAAEITAGNGTITGYNFLSYFARATYVMNDRYFIKGSIRRDGSSRFGSNNRFGTFPAVSVGWIMSEESFLKDNNTLSFLKLRASYGQLGNSEIGNFPSRFLFGGVSYNQRPGIAPTQPGNNDLTWEKSSQLDLGLEFGFLDNRISGEIDVYNKETDGLLFSVPLPGSSGAASINRNIGVLESKGVEFILNTENFSSDKFSWKTSLNISKNVNEIISLPNDNADIINGRNINRIGESVLSFYLPEYAGVDPDNGDALYYINGEGTGRETTNNIGDAERIVAGIPSPEWIGGLTNTLTYGDLSLQFTFMGEWGADIYNSGGRFQSANGNFEDNQTIDQLNRWQNPGDITDVPQARLFGFNGYGHSTRWLQNADFIRLRNLTFSYNIPSSVLERVGFSYARVYLTGVNLLTFTDYPGYDPESRADSGNFNSGQAFYSAPPAKTVSVGLNINF
jgi:TonB-linked SusC/RagA family outer membrane protein